MSDPTSGAPAAPAYHERPDAPVVYFDLIAAHGVMNGAIQIELACRVLTPGAGTDVTVSFTPSGRLRCSPVAARGLRDSIDAALKMFEEPQQTLTAASKLN
jgi:hypothetical protein